MLEENLAVVSGRHSNEKILKALVDSDSVVILKAGKERQRLIKLISKAGRENDAQYLEYIARGNEFLESDITLLDGAGPYFSLFLIIRNKEQP